VAVAVAGQEVRGRVLRHRVVLKRVGEFSVKSYLLLFIYYLSKVTPGQLTLSSRWSAHRIN
jgi:hypothetical protein